MKVYAKDLKVGQFIMGEIISWDGMNPFLTRNPSKKNKKAFEILKITQTSEFHNNGRLTEIKSYILTFKDVECQINDRQKIELA